MSHGKGHRISKGKAQAQAEAEAVRQQQARDFSDAHAQGHHDEIPRDGCPECEDQRGRL